MHLSHIHYLPSGFLPIIGNDALSIILETNNQLLTHGATVPVGDFDPDILDITIPVNTKEMKDNSYPSKKYSYPPPGALR